MGMSLETIAGFGLGSLASAVAAGSTYFLTRERNRSSVLVDELVDVQPAAGSRVDLLGRDLSMLQTSQEPLLNALNRWLTVRQVANVSYFVFTDDIAVDAWRGNPRLVDLAHDQRFHLYHVADNEETHPVIKYLWTRHFALLDNPKEIWLAGCHPEGGKSQQIRWIKCTDEIGDLEYLSRTLSFLRRSSTEIELSKRIGP
jgi:hypothetical protein